MTKKTTYAPNTERSNANKAIAHNHSAILALLAGINDSLMDCTLGSWGEAADTHNVANKLLEVYCFLNQKQDGDSFELRIEPESSSDDALMVFNVKGI